jgi:tetratricopeptide (TPR) repeat protein
MRPAGATMRPLIAIITVVGLLALAGQAGAQRPGQGEDESAALVEEGRAALKRGKLDDAARALDQALALNPRRVEAYVLRSAVHAARREHEQGIQLMRRAQALAPGDDEVLVALGSHLLLAGDAAAGVPLLAQVTARNPARYDAQLLLGHHHYGRASWPEAIAALEAYFAHRPRALAGEDPRYRVDLGDAYLRARQPTQALARFEQALRDKPGDLRARIGVAWATAALDCRKARPLLERLAELAASHPEIWLVDGQCALAMDDISGALALGRRYLEKAPSAGAAGHALVGEAQAARGNLAEARRELEKARALEPGRRRWPVRLAVVLRRAGDPAAAFATLEQIGAPERPAADPDWWTEVGEALLARGQATATVERLAPVIAQLPDHAAIRTVLGAAQLEAGSAEAAIETLDTAHRLAATPRVKRLLVDALVTVAHGKLQSGEAAAAETLLVRADALDDHPVVWRNLGVARLALDRPADAIEVLDRAVKAEPSGTTLMLAARARALAGDGAGARPLYERALATDKDHAVDIALDWAASELSGGEPAIAVTALEKTAAKAKAGPLAARHKTALATARHAAGVAALRAGAGRQAVELLRAAAAAESSLAIRCDLALAAVVAGDAAAALAALRAITGQSCPFPPPADTQAAPILIAFTEGLTPRRAGAALDRLTALAPRSTGPAAALLGTSLRVVALEAAREAYAAGRIAQARQHLTAARKASSRVGTDELAHNLAVLDLAEGKLDAAIAQLERLTTKLPEALVNLGIAYDRKGEPQKALDAWRRARRAGARFAPLGDWIDAKERVHGKGEP